MKLYRDLAAYYDEIYGFKNYEKESGKIKTLIARYKKSNGRKLLDVACGTGNHISFLKRRFLVEGIDSSPDMLRVARKKHPDVVFHRGDMSNFNLQSRYDAITCLFSAIGHLRTRKRMKQAVQNMAAHLRPGGVLIIEPWITPHDFKIGTVGPHFVNKPDLKIARINIAKVKDPYSNFEYRYLIGTPDRIRHIIDRESMGLWTHTEYMSAARRSGLKAKYDPSGLMGRGLYIGVKPSDNRIVPTNSTPVR